MVRDTSGQRGVRPSGHHRVAVRTCFGMDAVLFRGQNKTHGDTGPTPAVSIGPYPLTSPPANPTPTPRSTQHVATGSPCAAMQRYLSELFECAPAGERTRVRTPFLYPDGGVVDLFVRPNASGGGVVSDLGESAAWLRMQTASIRRSPKQSSLIEDAARTVGVERFKGALMARFDTDRSLADAIQRVGLAAVRVSDIWFTFRTRAVESINDEVADALTERGIAFDRGERRSGRSGRAWPVDFHVVTPERSSLVMVAATGNRSAAQRVTEHIVATWYDLNHLTVGPQGTRAVTLVDDTSDVWTDENLNLMGSLSTLTRWSNIDGFVQTLRSAA